jgi:DNA primase
MKHLKPEKQISFLFLPNKEDPDSFVNKKGKNYFLDFTKKNKVPIHQFIFDHHKKQTENNPSSLAILDKKLRSITNNIKDNFIKKYVLEYFLDKLSELAPHTSQGNKKNFFKKTNSLETTRKYFKESEQLSGVELKEFSLLYLLINNFKLIQENIGIVENVKLFTEVNKQIFNKTVSILKTKNDLIINDLDIDKQLIDKINKFAPIKYILRNKSDDPHHVLELLEDIIRDLNNLDLEFRIQELESKFSKDLSEVTFNELKELKKKQNIN